MESPVMTTKTAEGTTITTAEELLRLPRGKHRYELVKGELREMCPASSPHGRVANQIAFLLTNHIRQHKLGAVYAAETGFKLRENPDTVRAADVAFIAQERIPAEGEPEGFWAIAPDLVVEVVSPGDTAVEVQDKVTDWLQAGCRWCGWFIPTPKPSPSTALWPRRGCSPPPKIWKAARWRPDLAVW